MKWKIICLFVLGFQSILTLNHIKFFPFSDHGIFELYREARGQKFYRVKTVNSFPEYIDEGITFEISKRVEKLFEKGPLKGDQLEEVFGETIQQIDEYRLWKNPDKTGVAIEKNVVYRKY